MAEEQSKHKRQKKPPREEPSIVIKGKKFPLSFWLSIILGFAAYIMGRIITERLGAAEIIVDISEDITPFLLQLLSFCIASAAPILFITGIFAGIAALFFKSKLITIADGLLISCDFILLLAVMLV